MATVWPLDLLWTEQIGRCTGILRGAPAHLTVWRQPLVYCPASSCSSVGNLALSTERVAGEGLSSDGRRQEQGQELLWRQFFLDPTMWWDNRQDKRGFRSPDFRHKGSGEVLWLNNMFKPAWVDEQLVSWDMQMGLGDSPCNVSTLCQQGKLIEAFGALESLAQTDCPISPSLLYTVLKECAAKKDLDVGRRVHDLCVKLGYESDTYLGNHILRMYAGGGRLQEAMDVFTKVGKPDAFMWSSIISAHAKHGKPEEAMKLYNDMRSSGMKADAHVFVAALQACALAADLESGRKVHCDVLYSGIPPNLLVGNCLVNMYAKCGKLEDAHRVFDSLAIKNVVTGNTLIAGYSKCGKLQDARRVFDSLATKNVVSWNALIAGYAQFGAMEEARQLFDSLATKDVVTWTALIAGYAQRGFAQDALDLYGQMEEEGLMVADHVTFACLLKACASIGGLQKGRQLHSQIVERGLLENVLLGNCLVDMYAKCGELRDAQGVFDSLATKDVVTWNALITGYAQEGLSQEALALCGQMEEEGLIVADHVTFACLLKACGSTGALQEGRQLHSQIVERGLLDNILVGTCLVDMYAKCGELEDARKVFDSLATKNAVTWTALIAGYAKSGELECAREVFDSLPTKNVVTWNALIAGYVQQELSQEALVLYGQMEQEGLIVADHVTFACLLKACGSAGALQKGRQLHSQIVERGLLDNILGTCLVDMYTKCGELEEARRVFDSLATKDVVTWNALISGCGACDEGHKALACFEEMLVAGIQPDDSTFTCVLVACSHEGLVNEGRKYFNSMVEQHGLKPNVGHYICMIDLLGRAGNLDEAENMLLSCDGQSSVVGLRSLLNACKIHGDIQRATRCFESLVRLEPQQASPYVLMANAYANAGMWTDVERIETQRKAAGAKKKPAVAGIEVNQQVHTFVVGESRNDIALKVESMNARLKQEGGHVPHTNLVLKPVSEREKEDALCGHAEKLALAYGLLNTPSGTPLVVTKNLRMCNDCHSSTEIMSRVEQRDIVVRDGYRVHRFAAGCCSCKGRP